MTAFFIANAGAAFTDAFPRAVFFALAFRAAAAFSRRLRCAEPRYCVTVLPIRRHPSRSVISSGSLPWIGPSR